MCSTAIQKSFWCTWTPELQELFVTCRTESGTDQQSQPLQSKPAGISEKSWSKPFYKPIRHVHTIYIRFTNYLQAYLQTEYPDEAGMGKTPLLHRGLSLQLPAPGLFVLLELLIILALPAARRSDTSTLSSAPSMLGGALPCFARWGHLAFH